MIAPNGHYFFVCVAMVMQFRQHLLVATGSHLADYTTVPHLNDSVVAVQPHFSVVSTVSTVLPCSRPVPITVTGPRRNLDHPSRRDVIRLYLQQHPQVASNPHHRYNIASAAAPVELVYVAEKLLRRHGDVSRYNLSDASRSSNGTKITMTTEFDCETFQDLDDIAVVGYCFKYVSIDDSSGHVTEDAMLCLPKDLERVDGGWSEWSPWTGCSLTCTPRHSQSRGVRFRYRTCNEPSPSLGGTFCAGSTVDSAPCSGQPRCKLSRTAYSAASSSTALSDDDMDDQHINARRCAKCGNCRLSASTKQTGSILLWPPSTVPVICPSSVPEIVSETTNASAEVVNRTAETDLFSPMSSPPPSTLLFRRTSWIIDAADDVAQLSVLRRPLTLDEFADSVGRPRDQDGRGEGDKIGRKLKPIVELRIREGSDPFSNLLLSLTLEPPLLRDNGLRRHGSHNHDVMITTVVSRLSIAVVELSVTYVNVTSSAMTSTLFDQQPDEDESELDDFIWTLSFIKTAAANFSSASERNSNVDSPITGSNAGGNDVVVTIGIVLFFLTVTIVTAFVLHSWRRRDITLSRCCACSNRVKTLPEFLAVASSEQNHSTSHCAGVVQPHRGPTGSRNMEFDSCMMKLSSSSSSANKSSRQTYRNNRDVSSPSTVVCYAGTYPGSDNYYKLFRPSIGCRTENSLDRNLPCSYESRDHVFKNGRKVAPVTTLTDFVTLDMYQSNSLGYGGSISYC